MGSGSVGGGVGLWLLLGDWLSGEEGLKTISVSISAFESSFDMTGFIAFKTTS